MKKFYNDLVAKHGKVKVLLFGMAVVTVFGLMVFFGVDVPAPLNQ